MARLRTLVPSITRYLQSYSTSVADSRYTEPVARLSNPDSIAYPDPHEFPSSYLKDPDCGAYVWILPEIVKNNPVLANGVLRPNSWT